jgi:hypothetical protein
LPTFSGTGNIASTTVLTVTAITTGSIGPGVLVAGSNIPAGAYITEQLYGATGTSIANTTATGTPQGSGSAVQNITVVSNTGIAVGHLIAGNGAQVAGIRADTYVTNIAGTTITLSNSLQASLTAASVYFYAPGGLGGYTMSAAATATTTGVALTSSGQYFAGGGGGVTASTSSSVFFPGGAGGGGAGGNNASTKLNGQSGGVNTGGGAGGSRDANGGTGGSGIVVIRYPDTYALAAATTGSPTVTTAGGYRVYAWTGNGSITF